MQRTNCSVKKVYLQFGSIECGRLVRRCECINCKIIDRSVESIGARLLEYKAQPHFTIACTSGDLEIQERIITAISAKISPFLSLLPTSSDTVKRSVCHSLPLIIATLVDLLMRKVLDSVNYTRRAFRVSNHRYYHRHQRRR